MKLMVIDGNSILNRAFYGIRELTNKEGLSTNGIYGFLTTYFKLLADESPDKVVVCFDVRAKTFRHEQHDWYKATRTGMPEELREQVPILKDILDAMAVDRYELAGFEADDLIGTISKYCNDNSHECIIVTGDKDSLQLATDKTTINLVSTRMGKTTTTKYDHDVFVEKYGFEPMILTDLKGLMGDSSDNIPGVRGIGEKTAMTLLHEFNNIEGIYENIESDVIKKGQRQKLIDDKENAFISREVATIVTDVSFDFDINKKSKQDDKKLLELLKMLEFKNLVSKFEMTEVLEDVKVIKKEFNVPEYKTVSNINEIKFSKNIVISGSLDKLAIISDGAYLIKDPSHEFLAELFQKDVIMHDAKDILVKLFNKGITPKDIKFDTALAMYLLNPSKSEYLIEDMCEEIFGNRPEIKEQEITLFSIEENNDDIFIKAVAILEIYNELSQKLNSMEDLYYNIEIPLMTVLAEMQSIGIKIDTEELRVYGDKLMVRIKELTSTIYELAGTEFNINSPKQLGEILFERLELPVIKKTKTGYSTNVDVLQALLEKHPIIEFILEYRTLAKLHSTYVEGLLKVTGLDQKIHSTFNQMVTTTGRLSSTDPNLQNIPVRTPIGSELRKMFVADDGYVLVDADYSQIELRILAHISKDPVMIDAFKQGVDIHTVTASQVFDVAIEDVTPQMRSSAKAVNFGIVYGISEFSLGIDIGVSRAEAKKYIDNYLEKYSGVSQYMEDIKKKAYEDGFVTTLFNRRRDLPELKSKNFNMRSFGERVALNTPIQGTAADIIKIAMVNVYKRLNAEKLKSRMILQIHDELIIEATLDEQDYVCTLLKEEMENAFDGLVTLLVEYNVGSNWYEAK